MKISIPECVQTEIDSGSLFVVNHSGGKDSQAMTALLSFILPEEQVLVVHAEMPEVDWEGIPSHIMKTVPAGWPIMYVRAGKTFFQMVMRRFTTRPDVPSFPSPSTRQCTSDLKRGPIDKLVRQYLKLHSRFNGRVVHCVGLRAEESANRAKAETWKIYSRETKAGRTVFHWLPIHSLTEADVFSVIREAGQSPHAAYAAGMSRLSCCFCIMSSAADLRRAAELKPDLLRRYIALEERTGYTMNMSGKPLRTLTSAVGLT